MSYSQWRQELQNRKKAAAAGEPYKSPTQLKAEAEEMRRIAEGSATTPPANVP